MLEEFSARAQGGAEQDQVQYGMEKESLGNRNL
jgi:hypothetical protein